VLRYGRFFVIKGNFIFVSSTSKYHLSHKFLPANGGVRRLRKWYQCNSV